MKFIDAYKLLEVIAEQERWNVPDFVYESIKNAPIIEAEPTRHGEWIGKAEDWRHQVEWFECSLCDFPTSTAYKYCPNCGARMDAENEVD